MTKNPDTAVTRKCEVTAKSAQGSKRGYTIQGKETSLPSDVASLAAEYVEKGLIGGGELVVVSELELIMLEGHESCPKLAG